MDDVKGHLEGVSLLYQQLDEKISDKGGLGNLIGLHNKIRESLEAINMSELDSLASEIQKAKETLSHLQEMVAEIRVLKEVFAAPRSRSTSLGQRN